MSASAIAAGHEPAIAAQPMRIGVAADVARFVRVAREQGERAVGRLRCGFCAAVLLRFCLIHDVRNEPRGFLVNVLVLLAGMGVSLIILRRVARSGAPPSLFCASVLCDSFICSASLLQTVCWPSFPAAYSGLLTMPDTMALVLVVCGSSFRLSPLLAAMSGMLNTGMLLLLLELERTRWDQHIEANTSAETFYLLLLAAATALAMTWACWSLRLVRAAALDASRIERARARLDDVARAQHDARTLLSTVALQLDAWADAVRRPPYAAPDGGVAEQLREQVQSLGKHVQEVASFAFEGSRMLEREQAVETQEVLPDAILVLRRRFSMLRIDATLGSLPRARIVGGRASLERALCNLLQNALEGDGVRGASVVRIETRIERGFVVIAVRDDGPGLLGPLRRGLGKIAVTSKPRGTGLGIYGIAQLIEASGGALTAFDHPSGGACIELWLRLCSGA